MAVSGRTIPVGAALAFTFDTEAGKRVNISVQADTDDAEPDFQVVIGEVDFQDLEQLPIADLVIASADDRSPGQAKDDFTPEVAGPYTVFITDDAEEPDAEFSVIVTQRQ